METMEGIFEVYELEVELEKVPGYKMVIRTHGVPLHADDILAIEMIIRLAVLEWILAHSVDGVILLNIPGSKFSDKVELEQGKPKKESTCVKVARSLGVLEDPKWQKLIEYVNRDDMNGSGNATDILTLLKRGQLQNPLMAEKIIDRFMEGLMVKCEFDNGNKDMTFRHIAEIMQQNRDKIDVNANEWLMFESGIYQLHKVYRKKAEEELEQLLKKGQVLIERFRHGGQEYSVAGVNSLNYRMKDAVRHRQMTNGNQLAHISVVNSPGVVIVIPDKNVDFDLSDVTATLRFMEAVKTGNRPDRPDWKELHKPGTSDIAPAWFYNTHYSPPYLINSLSHDAPPTKLSLQQLVGAVAFALDEKRYSTRPDVANSCRNGRCQLGTSCPNLQIGLRRCVANYMR